MEDLRGASRPTPVADILGSLQKGEGALRLAVISVVLGAMAAELLYGAVWPIITVDAAVFSALEDGGILTIDGDRLSPS